LNSALIDPFLSTGRNFAGKSIPAIRIAGKRI
jgi:hypothetical protein